MTELNVLSLFAGIGGLELGLERAGMTIVGQVEIDPYCQKVLARHWPTVPRHDDVTTATEWWANKERPRVDLICAGFPCQPFSLAGRQLGVSDERWMWPATARVIRSVGPRFVLLENVSVTPPAMRRQRRSPSGHRAHRRPAHGTPRPGACRMIPQQPLGKDICTHCQEPIHLANHNLGPIWKHSNDVEWCSLRALPTSRPWPEEVPR